MGSKRRMVTAASELSDRSARLLPPARAPRALATGDGFTSWLELAIGANTIAIAVVPFLREATDRGWAVLFGLPPMAALAFGLLALQGVLLFRWLVKAEAREYRDYLSGGALFGLGLLFYAALAVAHLHVFVVSTPMRDLPGVRWTVPPTLLGMIVFCLYSPFFLSRMTYWSTAAGVLFSTVWIAAMMVGGLLLTLYYHMNVYGLSL